jgi:hypothetical protein
MQRQYGSLEANNQYKGDLLRSEGKHLIVSRQFISERFPFAKFIMMKEEKLDDLTFCQS